MQHLKQALVAETFVLCTTTKREDNVLENLALQNGLLCFRGSSEDILARLNGAANQFGVDFIVNVEADDVFCDPKYADLAVERFTQTGADFIRWVGLPLGASPIGIRAEALAKVCSLKDIDNTETGWGSFFTDTGMFKVETIEEEDPDLHHPEIRITMDYPEDYEMIKAVYRKLNRTDFTLRDVMRVINENPAIAAINRHLQEEYYRRFDEKRVEVRLKRSRE